MTQLEKAVRPNLFVEMRIEKSHTSGKCDQGSISWGIKGSLSTVAIVGMAWQRPA